MRARSLLAAALLSLDGIPAAPEAAAPPPEARLRVGPDLLVSRDGDFPHVETHLAVSPRDPRHLLGGAMGLDGRGDRTRAYVSRDGGWTWEASALALPAAHGQTRAGNAVLMLSEDGAGTLAALATVAGGGQVDLILDVNGYFE